MTSLLTNHMASLFLILKLLLCMSNTFGLVSKTSSDLTLWHRNSVLYRCTLRYCWLVLLILLFPWSVCGLGLKIIYKKLYKLLLGFELLWFHHWLRLLYSNWIHYYFMKWALIITARMLLWVCLKLCNLVH